MQKVVKIFEEVVDYALDATVPRKQPAGFCCGVKLHRGLSLLADSCMDASGALLNLLFRTTFCKIGKQAYSTSDALYQ